ncbi:hypothetical protein RJ640_016246 [Escallonia rubra]|uniref:SWIM-type domain-containing protein n=1 Tax=Escallonia rubra TaxID=112253 RepID=A0AA88R201_9ASTE|nr:hypothetical protein RJ640_016246 [Escallonia rubra]
MADTGRTVSQSFQSIEQVDENVNLTYRDIHDIVVQDEAEADDYDVWGFSRYDDEDFNGEHINGKTFDTQEASYEFYSQYALLNGFGTCKHNAHKIMATGAIFRRQFMCNKQGFKKLDDKRLNGNEKRHRDLRTGCEAMMQVTLSKNLGTWVVDKFQDINNHPLTTTPSKVIKHHSHSKYHRTIKEWNASVSCSHITWSKEPNITKYRVGLITVDKERWRTIYYYSTEDVGASCSCAKFETDGMLCKHILYNFKKKKIIDLPKWTINARYKVGDVGDRMDEISKYSAEKEVSLLTLWSVQAKFSKAIENAKNSPSEICEVDSWLSSFLEKQAVRKNEENFIGGKMGSQVDSSTSISQVESMNQISIRDSTAPVKTKGRPKVATRLKSSVELAKEEKKQRT